jgi:hypothetical protein
MKDLAFTKSASTPLVLLQSLLGSPMGSMRKRSDAVHRISGGWLTSCLEDANACQADSTILVQLAWLAYLDSLTGRTGDHGLCICHRQYEFCRQLTAKQTHLEYRPLDYSPDLLVVPICRGPLPSNEGRTKICDYIDPFTSASVLYAFYETFLPSEHQARLKSLSCSTTST